MERRQYTREFKLEAVKLIGERGVTVAQASRVGEERQDQEGPRLCRAGCFT